MVAIALIYLAAFAGAEAVTALVNPLWGIVLHLVLLFGLIVASAKASKHQSPGLFLALGLVPLIRIVSLSMPSAYLSRLHWYLIMSFPLIFAAFAIVKVLNRRLMDIGLTVRAIPLQILVASCGIGIGLLDYVVLRPEPLISALSLRGVVLPALILLFATGFVEEMIFRGVIQREAEALGSWGWVYTAVLSSMLQIGHHSVVHWILAFAMALLFGWTVKRGGSILGVSLSHGLINIGLYLVFPFVTWH